MSRLSSTHQRDAVHQELTALLGTGGDLARPPHAVVAFLDERLRDEVAAEYMHSTSAGLEQGYAAIVTAGPPGAGKSTALTSLANNGYRRIDPDRVKDMLLQRLDAAGLLSVRHANVLADGDRVRLGELAAWVHPASVDVADAIRAECLQTGENFVVEGTLSWPNLARVLTEELAAEGYEHLTIVDVEVSLATAQQQARHRWWKGRTTSTDPLGGRFVADDIIASFYPDDIHTVSICATRARALYAAAQDLAIPTDLRTLTRTTDGAPRTAAINARGVHDWLIAGIKDIKRASRCYRCGRLLTSETSIARGFGNECAGKV